MPVPDDPLLERKLGAIEALLFASDEPLNADILARSIEAVLEVEVDGLIEILRQKYEDHGHGITIQRVAGGWRLATSSDYADIVKMHFRGRLKSRLSKASLEAVSIIAYRQPISRAEIELIRGVDSAPVLRNLLERNLIKVAGRAEAPGRPLLYATTDDFLTYFGLDSIRSLPKPEEILGDLEENQPPDREGPFQRVSD